MARKRSKGEKLPTNLIKIAIVLFLRDKKKTTSEIRDYLGRQFGITEPKGIRMHLQWLHHKGKILDKFGKKGLDTTWEWKKTLESFKKIVNFLHSNSEIVKKLVEFNPIDGIEEHLPEEDKTKVTTFFQSMTPEFKVERYWYNTKYARSFFNKNIIRHFVHHTYEDHRQELEPQFINEDELKAITFPIPRTDDFIVTLMHYSPSLVRYIINLEDHLSEIIKAKRTHETSSIFLMILKDIVVDRQISHGGTSSTQYGIQRTTSDSDVKGLKISLECLLHEPKVKNNANS